MGKIASNFPNGPFYGGKEIEKEKCIFKPDLKGPVYVCASGQYNDGFYG